jgi:hypothetical protein
MQKFLMDFFSTAGAVVLNKKTKGPDSKVERGETVVGVLPDELKRFSIALRQAREAMRKECPQVHEKIEAILTAGPSRMKTGDLEAVEQHLLAHKRQDLLADIFWQAVTQAFPRLVLSQGEMGIREGWKVVTSPPARQCPRVQVIDLSRIPIPPGFAEALLRGLGGD